MPQISLEYTRGIDDIRNWNAFFNEIHSLVHRETGIPLESCKSRALCHDHFFIGEGKQYTGFIHLEVAICLHPQWD